MELYSLAFLGFSFLCIIAHELVGAYKPKYQWVVRLLASVGFYIWIAGIRILFLLFSALTIWIGAIGLKNITDKGKKARKAEGLTKEDKKLIKTRTQNKKRIVMLSIVIFNLGILSCVKYVLPVVSHRIILPLGISFYTFQAVAYIIDVYGEKYAPQKNFAKVLLYLSWFPQLIQGPINRYDHINHDLYKEFRLSWDMTKYAFLLFLFGAIKRYAIGDALAPLVNDILGGEWVAYPGSCLLFGAFLYAIEQYANFSGGIDMVMAVSILFGVKMDVNFRQPYFSRSLAEFWRRWHITLGAWMRDYVFYPFAMLKPMQKLMQLISDKFGKHWGRAVTGGIGNILIFAIVGIWHGPELHYLAWGLYNGVIIALSDVCSPAFKRLKIILRISDDSKPFALFQMLRTFMIIVFAGYFDITRSVSIGIQCFQVTFVGFGAGVFTHYIGKMYERGLFNEKSMCIALIGVIITLICSICKEKGMKLEDTLYRVKTPLRFAIYYFLIFFFLYSFTTIGGGAGFMYAAF